MAAAAERQSWALMGSRIDRCGRRLSQLADGDDAGAASAEEGGTGKGVRSAAAPVPVAVPAPVPVPDTLADGFKALAALFTVFAVFAPMVPFAASRATFAGATIATVAGPTIARVTAVVAVGVAPTLPAAALISSAQHDEVTTHSAVKHPTRCHVRPVMLPSTLAIGPPQTMTCGMGA
ncbi:hypothetical protein CDN98_11950 [Roseateles terrae]|nr:hypothetical protein CDN98_11950 [Roseateles terrae]